MINNKRVPKKEIVKVSPRVNALILDSFRKSYGKVSKSWKSGAETSLSQERAMERVDVLKKLKSHGKVLEIGSGSGILLACLAKKGYDVYGVEPDKLSYNASRILFKDNKLKCNIKNNRGEKIEFESKYFDLIISYQVIEHVQDPLGVFKECGRVLKKGGVVYFVIPNYSSFWEGHYGILWFPLLWKPIAKLYVSMLGRNPDFLDDIKYITPAKVSCWCKKSGLDVIRLGKEEWMSRMINPNIREYGNLGRLKRIVRVLTFLRMNKFVAYFGKWFNCYYPIILLARKKVK